MFTIGDDGLQPRFFRRQINAALDAPQFINRDLVRAGGADARGGARSRSNDRLAYDALPPERRGAKIYQRVMAGGLLAE